VGCLLVRIGNIVLPQLLTVFPVEADQATDLSAVVLAGHKDPLAPDDGG
jgi:hypothetical protein